MEPSALSLESKITLVGIINFLSIVVISIGDKSKTFWDSNELISFSKAEFHFSGLVTLGYLIWILVSRLDSIGPGKLVGNYFDGYGHLIDGVGWEGW